MDTDPRGYYAALHVTPAATQAEIQRAFRALIRLHHPDVGSEDASQTGADIRNILTAFAVLRDPAARAEYDRTGVAAGAGAGSGADGGTARRNRGRSPDGAPSPDGATPAESPSPAGARDIPVRHHRTRGPALRVTPVRWEQGPWEGRT